MRRACFIIARACFIIARACFIIARARFINARARFIIARARFIIARACFIIARESMVQYFFFEYAFVISFVTLNIFQYLLTNKLILGSISIVLIR